MRPTNTQVRNKVGMQGYFDVLHYRKGKLIGKCRVKNIVVNEGKNHALDSTLGAATQVPVWYLGLFEGDYTPTTANVGASFPGLADELTDYDELSRPTWQQDGASGQSISNAANRATFTISTGVVDRSIFGLFLISANPKGTNGGTLFGAARFNSPRVVNATDELLVSYTVNAT